MCVNSGIQTRDQAKKAIKFYVGRIDMYVCLLNWVVIFASLTWE